MYRTGLTDAVICHIRQAYSQVVRRNEQHIVSPPFLYVQALYVPSRFPRYVLPYFSPVFVMKQSTIPNTKSLLTGQLTST